MPWIELVFGSSRVAGRGMRPRMNQTPPPPDAATPPPRLAPAGMDMEAESIGEKLRKIIDVLPPGGVKMSEIRDLFGQDGLMLLTAFLTIPFMIPVSIPGVSTVFGAAILLIGVSRFFGSKLWMPGRVEGRVLPSARLRTGLLQGLSLVRKIEKLTRAHRLSWLTGGKVMSRLNDLSLILGALLLMAPLGFIPFSNTLPGLALLFLSIGFLQRDGVFILLGHLSNVATMIYFSILYFGGKSLVEKIWAWLF